ncbi:MAG: TolC family protein [Oligoflexia bacterium]|nr:TolC family protein [Oligoflexia bacterium]
MSFATSNSFGSSLSLRQALIESLKHNLNIKISNLTAEEKTALVTKALGEFDLNLKLSYTQDHSDTPSSSSLDGVTSSVIKNTTTYTGVLSKKTIWGGEFTLPYDYATSNSNSTNTRIPQDHTTSFGITLSQPLIKPFYFGYFSRNHASAEYDWEIAQHQRYEQIIDSLVKTMGLYLDTLRDSEALYIKVKAKDFSEQTLEFTKAKLQLGKASHVDKLVAESKWQKDSEDLRAAKTSLQNKTEELVLNIYGTTDTQIQLAQNLKALEVPPPNTEMEVAITEALKARSELRSAEIAVNKADAAAGAASIERLPSVTADGKVIYKGLASNFDDSQSQVKQGLRPSYTAGVKIEQPLLMYTSRGEYQSKSLQLSQEELKRLQIRRNITLEVRKHMRQLHTNWSRLEVLRAVVKAENYKHEGQIQRYQLGKISLFEYYQAHQDLVQAEFELIDAQTSYIRSLYSHFKSRGRLLKELGLSINSN